MEKYINFTGESKITHYEIGEEYILIKNKNGIIEYSTADNSKEHIEELKVLAKEGNGLHRYIMKNKLKKGRITLNTNTGVYGKIKSIFSF